MWRSFFLTLGFLLAGICSHGEVAQFRLFDRVAKEVALEYTDAAQGKTEIAALNSIAFGVWEIKLDLPPGDYEYRFVVDAQYRFSDIATTNFVRHDDGSIWSRFQLDDGKRFYNAARPGAEPDSRAKFAVQVGYRNANASSVKLAGEFNNWSGEPMRRVGAGEWQSMLHLREGEYAYKFVVDGEWLLDPENSDKKTVNGVENSMLRVNESTAISGTDTPATVQPVGDEMATVFRLYAPQADEVYLVGSFNNWNGSRDPMIRRGELWETTIPLREGQYQFKFKSHDDWWVDPNHPPTDFSDGNSVIEVKRPARISHSPIDPAAWTNFAMILLESNTGLHPFQQELPRQYIRTLAQDGFGLRIADATLLRPDFVPDSTPVSWTWRIEDIGGRPTMLLGIEENTYSIPLEHPLLDPPGEWLAGLREFAAGVFSENPMVWNGPTSPPPDSAWAQAVESSESGEALGGIFAVNAMTEFGRTEGWSRELCRDLAIAYVELASQNRFPSTSGWSPNVFAARAVVYADLARGKSEKDEIMAYVLTRIGRPADGTAMLPEEPATFYGKIASFMTSGDIRGFMEWVGTPDQFGFEARKDQPIYESQILALPDTRKAIALRALSDLLFFDEQATLSRLYLQAAMKLRPDDFAGYFNSVMRGGVSAGHRYARHLLFTAGCTSLWTSVMQGSRPENCAYSPASPRSGSERQYPDIDAITVFYKAKQRDLLERVSTAIPEATRLILLRDQLNTAWLLNARFFGSWYSSEEESRRLNKVMDAWRLLQPEMATFVRYTMSGVLRDYGYGDIRAPFERSSLGPNTFQYISLVRSVFTTWLMPKAQSFYPRIVYVQSDLLPDHLDSWAVYVAQNMDQFRANSRRLAPMIAEGYPAGGPLPLPSATDFEPAQMFENSYALNMRLGQSWSSRAEVDARSNAILFYERSLKISPYESHVYQVLGDLLMEQGRYQEVLELATHFPEETEALTLVAMENRAAFAALALGDKGKMLSFGESAAKSWQSGAMTSYAFLLDLLGRKEEARAWYQRNDERYGSSYIDNYWFRNDPEKAVSIANEETQWIEQFQDLEKANNEGRFSFNEFMGHPFSYAMAGRWDRALWLLKPLSEAVQTDYIWFFLLTVAEHENDIEARNLAQHVLADHVWNFWGQMPRFQRGARGWEDVVISARNEGKQVAMNYFASVLAEKRGDKDLAIHLLMQGLDPYISNGAWYTLTWQSLARLGVDPRAVATRPLAKDPQPVAVE